MAEIIAENLDLSFGGLRAVADLSFAARHGDITALIGPNGAGKTTTFNIISGLLKPDRGRVALGDTTLTGLPPHRVAAAGIGRTFQNLQLFGEMTVLENVMAGMYRRLHGGILAAGLGLPHMRREEAARRDEARALLERFGLLDEADKQARSLPFGKQRLLDIARALASRPSLLLLDEPAAGLISAEAMRLAALFRTLQGEGLTLLLVEHNMRLVMDVSDRVVVLNFGAKIFEGTPAEAQREPAVIEAYLGRPRERRRA